VVKSLKIRNNVPIPTATVTPTEAVFNFQPLNGTPEAPNGPTSTPAIVYPTPHLCRRTLLHYTAYASSEKALWWYWCFLLFFFHSAASKNI
jgi:hypothetical protein